MPTRLIIDLITNAALLGVLSGFYGLWARYRKPGLARDRILAGLLFGGVAIGAMMMPVRYGPGIIYDGRSIILTLAGLFGGGTAAVVSMLAAGAYRVHLGGTGIWAGMATIVSCTLVGLAVRRAAKNRPEALGPLALYGVGVGTHVVMLGCQLLLPWPGALHILATIAVPVLLVFPLATLLVGILLGSEELRVVAVDRLRESEARYAAAFRTSPDAICITGADGQFVDVNDGLAQLTGYTREDVIGQTDMALGLWVAPDDREAAFQALAATGAVENVVSRFRCKDGSEKSGLLSARTLQINGTTHILAVIRDVTGYLALESRLRQAQKMETLGKLAGGIAHDFNNLLTVILGHVELVLADLYTGHPHQELLREVQHAGHRARDITRQLLAFSRQQVVQPVLLDLNESAIALQRMMARVIGENITVTTVPSPEPVMVRADPGQVEQVLMNLLVNARDAMPAGGTLTVETANVTLEAAYASRHVGVVPGAYAMLVVTDTGSGIDRAIMDRIFDPFFTTKAAGKGTGLGLATVYGIIIQAGGHVACESEPGHGTTFRIYLPRADGAGAASVGAPAPERLPAGGGEQVFVVEDDAAVRDLVRRMLERLGYRVAVAASGAEALSLVTAGRVDPALVITDMVMPGMGGMELIGQLRLVRPDQRFLVMSGYVNDPQAIGELSDRGIPFLQKPPKNIGALAAKVRDALARGGA